MDFNYPLCKRTIQKGMKYMSKDNLNNDTSTSANSGISKSKAKRLAQQKARTQQKSKTGLGILLVIGIPVVIIALAIFLIKYADTVDTGIYSQYLNIDGTLKADVSQYCTPSLDNVSIDEKDIKNTSTLVQAEIKEILESHTTKITDGSHVIEKKDMVNIAYTATIDGEEIESWSETSPRLITAGSNTLTYSYDTVEGNVDEHIIGNNVGNSFEVDVTYKDDCPKADIAGKTVHYSVKIVSVEVTPTFDDNFVQLYLSDQASTAEEFISVLDKKYQDSKHDNLIAATMTTYCPVTGYPEDFLNRLVEDQKSNNQAQVDQYAALGYPVDIYQVYGVSEDPDPEASYNALVLEEAKNIMDSIIRTDAIAKYYGISVTKQEVRDYFYDNGTTRNEFNSYVKTYGWGYLSNHYLQLKVQEYLKNNLPLTNSEDTAVSTNGISDNSISDNSVPENADAAN